MVLLNGIPQPTKSYKNANTRLTTKPAFIVLELTCSETYKTTRENTGLQYIYIYSNNFSKHSKGNHRIKPW